MIGVGLGKPRFGTVIFDVDSTLVSIEGIDWLAALRGPAVERECANLTNRAMAGELPLEAVYAQRLATIAPSHAELDALAGAYQISVQPGAPEIVAALREAGVAVHLLSGGLRYAILPLARELGVPADHVHAVTILTDDTGRFVSLNGEQPLATQRGKPLVLSQMIATGTLPRPVVMIGDGSTDAATRGVVDQFFAYTRVARRESVVAVADAEAKDFLALLPLLFKVSA